MFLKEGLIFNLLVLDVSVSQRKVKEYLVKRGTVGRVLWGKCNVVGTYIYVFSFLTLCGTPKELIYPLNPAGRVTSVLI